jgi:putative ABC transport system permease protein
MARVVLRGFAARKLRALLTGAAIALGVALMAGTYILTDTINSSFASIFSTANQGHDVVVTPHQALGRNRQQAQTPPITDATLARVRSVSGVAQASGSIFSPAALLTDANRRLNTKAPSFITTVLPPRFESFSPIRGRFPASPGEVAVDQATADNEGLKVGQALKVAGAGGATRYTIVGIVKFAGSQNLGGAGAAMLTLPEAQRLAGEPGGFDQLDVAAAAGVSAGVLRARIRAALPASLDVRTGAEQAAQQTSDIKDNLSFLRTFLLIFAYVSLFVGAFIIFNTFSITVAQRTREFGLLRTLGATRRQVMGSVIGEGLLLGVAGSSIGLLAGLVIAPGLDSLFKAVGADLPDNGTVLEARTVIVSLAVGTVITVLSGLLPALRATRVPPVAALREGVPLPRRSPRQRSRRFVVAVVVILVARVIIAAASGGSAASIAITIAIAAVILVVVLRTGSFFWLPRLVPALARLVGGLVAWRGITGRLARENAIRQPGRTAVTAAALMIGLALVTFASILAAGTKASINQAVDRSFAGNLIVQNAQTNQDAGIPATVAPALRAVAGVRTVTPIAFSLGKVNRIAGNASVTAIDPGSFTSTYRIDWKQGSNATLGMLGATGTVLTKAFADSHHLKVGQTISVLTPADRRIALVVRGIASDEARLLGNLTITLPLARTAFAQREDALDFVSFAPGATNARVEPAVDRLLAGRFPQTVSKTAAQFKKDQAGQVNTLLYLIYALLALSVIVSLFGIVNTLVLSVFERTRELGMLRAIGSSRRQIRQMIRYESVITALIGGVMGLALGIVLGLISAAALAGQGFVLSIPVLTLALLLVAAGAAGVGAAVWPARRASQVDLLEALATQ